MPLVGMQWMRMPAWVCNGCKCPLVGISWHEYFDANTIYSKIPFIFKTRLPQRLKPKYSKLDLLSMKSHLPFDLRPSKKLVIIVRNLRIGNWFRIWWSGSKYLFSPFGWTKGVAHFQCLFSKKMNSLKIKHLKKIRFFFFSLWIW